MYTKNIVVIKTDNQKIFTLAFIKNYLRIDNDYDDEFLLNAIETAANYAEMITGKIFGSKTYRLKFTTEKSLLKIDDISLLNDDLVSISINDKKATHQDFEIKNGIICFKYSIKGNIDIVFKKDGISLEEIPTDIKQAILFHIANIYQNKNGNCAVPQAAQEIYNLYRKIRV